LDFNHFKKDLHIGGFCGGLGFSIEILKTGTSVLAMILQIFLGERTPCKKIG
jgi:hypothetical protein